MYALSSYQAAMQASEHRVLRRLSRFKGALVAIFQVDSVPSNPTPELTGGYIAGDETLIREGFKVEVRTSGSVLKGVTRLRYGATQTNSSVFIRELSRGEIAVANGDLLYIRREVRVSDKLVTADANFDPDGIPVGTFNTATPPIANSGGLWVGWVDAGQTYATVSFFGDLSFAVDPDSGGTLTHLWTLPAGAGSFAPGSSSSDENPTIRFNVNADGWLLEHTVTDDDNSASTTQYIPVIVHDADHPPYACVTKPQAGSVENGWSWSVELFEDADEDTLPDGSLVCLWVDERLGGVEQSVGSPVAGRAHIKGVGYLDHELSESQAGHETLTFDVIAPLAKLAQTPGFSKVMIRDASPDTWAKIQALTVYRGAVQLWQFYANPGEAGYDLIVDDLFAGRNRDYPIFFCKKNNPLGQIRELVKATKGRFICDRRGRFEIQAIQSLLYRDERTSLSTILSVSRADLIGSKVSKPHHRPVETFYLKGFAAHADDPTAVFARWPGDAPGQGAQSDSVERVITQNASTAFADCGLYGAMLDGWYVNEDLEGRFAPTTTLRFPLSHDGFDFYPGWVSMPFATRIRGHDLSQYRHEITGIRVSYENGDGEVLVDFQAETFGEPGVDDQPPTKNTSNLTNPRTIWQVRGFTSYDGTALLGNTAEIALLTSSGLTYTNLFTSSPTWTNESWLDGSALDLLDSGETIRDGVQKPGVARTIYAATNTKARVFINALDGTSVSLSYALRASSANGLRLVQAERGDPNICYILTNYSDGLWSEGHIGGVAITPVRIGANHDETTAVTKPAILVDPNNPLIAYAIAWNGSAYQWYKTVNGGVSWSTNSDYAWGLGQATFLARSFLDSSVVYAGAVISDFDAGIYKVTAGSTTLMFSDGGWNARGFRTLDSDPNVLLSVRYPFVGSGNFAFGIQKSEDQGDNWTEILADAGPHNVLITGPSGYFGADGSVYQCRAAAILFHPNIYNLTADSQFTDKTGTGYPAGVFVPLGLFGGLS